MNSKPIPPRLRVAGISDQIEKPAAKVKDEPLPLGRLPYDKLQSLCVRLLSESSDTISCQEYGIPGQIQYGIDLYARFSSHEKLEVWQCKRYQKFTPSDISNAVKVFIEGELRDLSFKFVLVTSAPTENRNLADAEISAARELSKYDVEFELLGLSSLSNRLKKIPEIVNDFFGSDWVLEHCGAAGAKMLGMPLVSHEPHVRSSSKFLGQQRQSLLEFYTGEWMNERTAVAVIQGLPGVGKTQLAAEISERSAYLSVRIEVHSDEPEEDVLFSLLSKLESHGILQIEEGQHFSDREGLLSSLEETLERHKVIVTIDEFQCLFRAKNHQLLSGWKRLIESLNNSSSIQGKLLLVSNQQLTHAPWNENCAIKNLNGLNSLESEELIIQLLKERDQQDYIPEHRMKEIGERLGGNPRAIKTLVGALIHGELDELMSFAPDGGAINRELLERFERDIIERSLVASSDDLKLFMRRVSAYRRPFKKDAISNYEIPLRNDLIDRFLLEFHQGYYSIHPLAREISISRLRENDFAWHQAQSCAADYFFRHFKAKELSSGADLSSAYIELRFHLYESGRISELGLASCRLSEFILSSISGHLLTQAPKSRLVLEERISLISELSCNQRPKRLDYHLALCLKTRNLGDDYEVALTHARRAVGPRAYYAYWLLLIELEYAVNGAAGLEKSYRQAAETLSEASNLSQIYKLVAELYEKDNQEAKAVEVLQESIKRGLPSGNDSLIRKCAELLEQLDRVDDAVVLLRKHLEIPDFDHRSILTRKCAELLAKSGDFEEAIKLLKHAIQVPEMSYLAYCYLDLAQYYESMSLAGEASKCLQSGIKDRRVKHKDKLHRRCAEILADEGHSTDALAELALKIKRMSPSKSLRLYHSYAQLAERAGRSSDAIKLLKAAVKKRPLSMEPSMFVVYSDLYFHLRDLDNAINVLKDGIQVEGMKNKSDLYTKLADLMHRKGLTDEAIKLLEESEEDKLIANRFSIFKKRSELLVKVNRIDDAIALNEDALSSSALTNKAVIYQSLATLLFKHRESGDALRKLKQALEDPSITAKVMIYQSYAKMLSQLERLDEAVELLKEAIGGQKMGNVVSLYKLCGKLAHRNGDDEYARKILKDGLGLYPSDIGLKKALELVT